ncbi:MAG TPA: DUF2934 domain-containing protein [Candidatus Polarisedimenticolia bacterium]
MDARRGPGKQAPPRPDGSPRQSDVAPEERRRLIAEVAYLKAESRGFQGGSPDRDWLEAESEIDAMLLPGGGARGGSSRRPGD